jgi:hypothetical protein
MTIVLIVAGIGLYLLVVLVALSLCQAAGRADEQSDRLQSERLLYAQRSNTVTPLGSRIPPDRGH